MKKEKVKLRKTELPVDMVVPGMAPREVGSLTEKEGQMIANDKLEKDRQVRISAGGTGGADRVCRRAVGKSGSTVNIAAVVS